MSNYIYIGKLYHLSGKELSNDIVLNFTNDLNSPIEKNRSEGLPIKFLILKAWKFNNSVNIDTIRGLIDLILFDYKTSQNNWYNLDFSYINTKVEKSLNWFFNNNQLDFKEVDLDSNDNEVEVNVTNEKKREENTTLIITVEGQDVSDYKANKGFVNFIRWCLNNNKFDEKTFKEDFGKLFNTTKERFPKTKEGRQQIEKINGYYMDVYSKTLDKLKYITQIAETYGIDVQVKQIPKSKFQLN
jgi:hypothetical protein